MPTPSDLTLSPHLSNAPTETTKVKFLSTNSMQMESLTKSLQNIYGALIRKEKVQAHSEGVNVFSNHIGLLENWNTSDEQYGAIF